MIKKTLGLAIFVGLLALALPAMAAKAPSAIQIACVASAVNAREVALDSAISTYTQAVNSTYTTRAAALQQAYSQTAGQGVIKTAVKTAWTNFTSALKSARKGWQTSRKSSWATFKSAVKTCKAPSVATDASNANSEATGN